jgi:benzodiazapine receptor
MRLARSMLLQPQMELIRHKPVTWLDARPLALQVANIVAFASVVVVNVLARAVPLAGRTSTELAERHPDPFSPAPYAFAIWNAIYGALFAYTVYQALPTQRNNSQLHRLAPWFWTSCAANIAWTFFWHYELVLASMLALAVLVGSLTAAYRVLHRNPEPPSRGERWCVYLPFSWYLGWTVVALLANLSVWAVEERFEVAISHPDLWAMATIAVATLVAAAMGWFRREPLFMQPVLWALIGIVVRYEVHPVSAAAVAGALVVVSLMARAVYLLRRDGPD